MSILFPYPTVTAFQLEMVTFSGHEGPTSSVLSHTTFECQGEGAAPWPREEVVGHHETPEA